MSSVTEQPLIAACSFCQRPNTEVERFSGEDRTPVLDSLGRYEP
jgi:hypothetical protein